jgi:hypothetical protein
MNKTTINAKPAPAYPPDIGTPPFLYRQLIVYTNLNSFMLAFLIDMNTQQ